MDECFQNKYRILTARATWHDYNGGAYFITICTAHREHYFGEIIEMPTGDPKMQLSEIGKIVDECIHKMETLHNDIFVPLYQIMPDHIHLIILVDTVEKQNVTTLHVETPQWDVSTGGNRDNINTPQWDVSTGGKNEKMQQIANNCGRLSHVLSQFKSVVTKYAKKHQIPFAWQTRFYDRIIRDQGEMNEIARYIENNIFLLE